MSDHEGLVQDQLLYIEHLEAERDAWAAHVALIKSWGECKGLKPGERWEQMMKIIDGQPTTSLARLIAEKQAEALEEYAEEVAGLVHSDHMMTAETWHGYLITEARKRRRQERGES